MRTAFNPFMPNGISHRYQLEQSISVLRDVRWYFSFCRLCKLCSKQWRSDQTQHSVVSDLGLHNLPMSQNKYAEAYMD